MKDKILDFIEDHRGLVIGGAIVLVLLIIMFSIRSYNLSKKSNEDYNNITEESQDISFSPEPEQTVQETAPPRSNYHNNLGLDKDKNKDERVEIVEETPTPVPSVEPVQTEPTYPVSVNIWGNTVVPDKNMDGSSCKAYLSKVKLSDFGTCWGTSLTDDDFKGRKLYLVGVEQDENDNVHGDLQSVGWLMKNINSLKSNDAVRFTNLHVIGSLSDNHVALLCSYDWYSAYGLDDTLVVFEDISNTLKVDDFKDGDIFSATVFAHNIKVLDDINGQRVVVVQYNTFN